LAIDDGCGCPELRVQMQNTGDVEFMRSTENGVTEMDAAMKDACMTGNVDQDFAALMLPHIRALLPWQRLSRGLEQIASRAVSRRRSSSTNSQGSPRGHNRRNFSRCVYATL
jgi:hypothetical protein